MTFAFVLKSSAKSDHRFVVDELKYKKTGLETQNNLTEPLFPILSIPSQKQE